jgi:hypothetical protein
MQSEQNLMKFSLVSDFAKINGGNPHGNRKSSKSFGGAIRSNG